MSLLDLIRRKRPVDIATAIHAIPAIPKPETGGTVARIATIAVANLRMEKSDIPYTVSTSRWWRVNFADRDPLETCFDPAVEAEKVLNHIAGAVSVEAISDGSPGLTAPDQYGHWSESEVELAKLRTALFVSRGVPFADADLLACRLVRRDRQGDDRRSCAECISMIWGRCSHGLQPFGGGGVEVLHRCKRFNDSQGVNHD